MARYIITGEPSVINDEYIKNRRTRLERIPSFLAHQSQTPKERSSKKNNIF
jgi:hypothetical protein